MIDPARFDRHHGKGAFLRLCAMLADPTSSYKKIGDEFGVTRQDISFLGKKLGVDARQRQHDRVRPRIIRNFEKYPATIQAVIDKLRRAGLRVAPYNAPQPSARNVFRTSLRTILVNGVLCTIQVRGTYKFRPNGREYACLEVGRDIMKGKIALFGFRRGRRMKLYVIPTLHLRNISFVYIPADGKYAIGGSKKPKKDWNLYENAWHWLDSRTTGAL